MRLLSSSTFSSEVLAMPPSAAPVKARTRSHARQAISVVAWTLLFLFVLDAALNVLFRFPTNPAQYPTSLQQYFEYGRSVDGKLNPLVGPTAPTRAPIAHAGWLEGNPALVPPPAASPGKIGARFYGMSFSQR